MGGLRGYIREQKRQSGFDGGGGEEACTNTFETNIKLSPKCLRRTERCHYSASVCALPVLSLRLASHPANLQSPL